jgi:hypothetical protein
MPLSLGAAFSKGRMSQIASQVSTAISTFRPTPGLRFFANPLIPRNEMEFNII